MDDATAGELTPETMERLATASATGRMLLAMVALWLDQEAGPAVALVERDTLRLSDEDSDAMRDRLAGPGDPSTLAAAMLDLLDAVGTVDLVNADAWARVRDLAGEWLTGERPPR